MNLPESLRPLFDRLPRSSLGSAPAAVFDASYKMSPWLARFTAARRLARKVLKLGGKLLLTPQTFHVIDREGSLYTGEIDRAAAWAKKILEKLDHS